MCVGVRVCFSVFMCMCMSVYVGVGACVGLSVRRHSFGSLLKIASCSCCCVALTTSPPPPPTRSPGSACGWGTGVVANVALDCSQGHYCPLGTPSPTSFPCPAGTYTAASNLTAESECTTCPEREFPFLLPPTCKANIATCA